MQTTIKAQKPYNFDLSCRTFSDGDPQIRKYEKMKFWQVLRVNNKLIYISVKSSGNVDEPELVFELKSNGNISDEDKELTSKIVSNIFNMDFDLSFFYKSVKNDEIMFKLTKRLFGLKNPTTPTVFEALVDSISGATDIFEGGSQY
jgi:DNA-3-methyladenine glycosylase II